jgi:hypothetical protein
MNTCTKRKHENEINAYTTNTALSELGVRGANAPAESYGAVATLAFIADGTGTSSIASHIDLGDLDLVCSSCSLHKRKILAARRSALLRSTRS